MDAASHEVQELEALARRDILCVRAPNPGPLTLTGTNSWVVGRDPAWVVDPGPAIASHAVLLAEAVVERGGLGGVVLTHGHLDHSQGAAELADRYGVDVVAGAPAAGRAQDAGAGADAAERSTASLREGIAIGPFEPVATPGHAPDHFALIGHGACFTGDAVLGSGSVFISPDPGAMAGYLRALEGLIARTDFDVLCPGHGPPVTDARARLAEYVAHRLEREARLLAALDAGMRGTAELLDDVWSDAPAQLRPAAAATLAAHLDKLDEEGRLPDGVERPSLQGLHA
jgi:glyoxylase-like metal-dependent hydrolase (beta-lactamase superfamily II)